MTLTLKQTENLKKIHAIIENAINTGNLRAFKNVPYLLDDAMYTFNGILQTVDHAGLSICSETANLFKKHGFKISEYGSGYKISF